MLQMSVGSLLSALTLTSVLIAAPGALRAQCLDSPWREWRELFNYSPDADDLARQRRENAIGEESFDVQRIGDAASDSINFDEYVVKVNRLPTGFDSSAALLDHFRRNMNDFFDTDIATILSHTPSDATAWEASGPAPVGSIQVFNIPVGPGVSEQAAVIVSRSSPNSWTFSTVTIDAFAPGEHPVSGHREFGVRLSSDGGYELYTRAADRATLGFPDYLASTEDDVFAGGDALGRSMQERLADFVVRNGGNADVVEPRSEQPLWKSAEVQDCLPCLHGSWTLRTDAFANKLMEATNKGAEIAPEITVEGTAVVRFGPRRPPSQFPPQFPTPDETPTGSYRTQYHSLNIISHFTIEGPNGDGERPAPLTLSVNGGVKGYWSASGPSASPQVQLSASQVKIGAKWHGWEWTDGKRFLPQDAGRRHERNQRIITRQLKMLSAAVSNISSRVIGGPVHCADDELRIGREVEMVFDRIPGM